MNKNLTLAFAALATLTECSSDGDLFDQADFVPLNNTDKLIKSYFSKEGATENATSEPAKIFIDFSDRMLYADRDNSNNSNILEAITHMLIVLEIKRFGLDGGRIYELNFQPTQLFNKATDTRSYSKDYLVSKGIDVNRMSYEGKGVSTKYEDDADNRRAEFVLQ